MLRAAALALGLALGACGGGGEVQLPRTDGASKASPSMHSQSISVEVSKKGDVLLDGAPVGTAELADVLARKYGELSERRIYLRVHAEAPYGKVMEVMEMLKATGAKLALVTDPSGGE